jgi:2OG-Fe(II) oxygenase superfamily
MTLDALKQSLESLPDPSIVEGTAHLDEPLAIALPDGDLGALADKAFVAWLVEHSEDAPFGHHGETKIDKKVRHAKRLVARGNAIVAGFDPMSVLPAIEKALSPRFHLDAKLEDVIVYEKGGKFTRHKDTPRTANLVGTLVVGLPIAHEGGAFTIVDGGKKHVVDWSGKPTRDEVKWVALFSDLDHAVEPVKSGARVTLVYSLSRSDRPRSDAARDKKLAKLHSVVAALEFEDPLMIACTRQIVSDGQQPQALDTLRGTDREIAELFVDAGYDVAVRACLTGDDTEGRTPAFPDTSNMWAITRLSKAIPDHVIAEMDEVVSFTDTIDLEEYAEEDGGEVDGTTLGSYVLDMVQMERWVIRKRAAATAVYEGMYSETGSFGNEASIGHVYTLAAIEVSSKKAKPKAKAKKKSR